MLRIPLSNLATTATSWLSSAKRLVSSLQPKHRWVRAHLRKTAEPCSAFATSPAASTAGSPSCIERYRITHYRRQLLLLHVHDTQTNAQWIQHCYSAADLSQFVLEFHAGTNTRVPTFLVSGLPHSTGDRC